MIDAPTRTTSKCYPNSRAVHTLILNTHITIFNMDKYEHQNNNLEKYCVAFSQQTQLFKKRPCIFSLQLTSNYFYIFRDQRKWI